MVCLPVRGDNSRALATELSPVQAGNHGITILYHLYISVDLTPYEIFRAKVCMFVPGHAICLASFRTHR